MIINLKELRSIDLASFTIMATSIAVLISVIASVIIAVAIGSASAEAFSFAIYLIPTIVVGTLMYGIYSNFLSAFLYNVLGTKLKKIKMVITDGEIVKISLAETAIIVSIISTIELILIYLSSVLIFPLVISTVIQTFAFAGQQNLAYGLYQLLMILSQPITIIIIIAGSFILSFAYCIIGTFIYNFLGNMGRGVRLELSSENNFTVVDSIDSVKLGIVVSVISGVMSIISGVLLLLSGGNGIGAVGSIIIGFVIGFILGTLIGAFYNFLAPRLGKLKIELV